VTHPPAKLTIAHLEELEELLRERGAGITKRWRTPRSPRAVAEEIARLGLAVPDEAAVWWAWHDGVLESAPLHLRCISLGWYPLTVEAAVEATLARRRSDQEFGEWNPWRSSWIELCFDGSHGALAVDAGVAPGEPSPVTLFFDNDEPRPDATLPSVGELVLFWIAALRDGVLRVDGDGGGFAYLSPEEKAQARGVLADLL